MLLLEGAPGPFDFVRVISGHRADEPTEEKQNRPKNYPPGIFCVTLNDSPPCDSSPRHSRSYIRTIGRWPPKSLVEQNRQIWASGTWQNDQELAMPPNSSDFRRGDRVPQPQKHSDLHIPQGCITMVCFRFTTIRPRLCFRHVRWNVSSHCIGPTSWTCRNKQTLACINLRRSDLK